MISLYMKQARIMKKPVQIKVLPLKTMLMRRPVLMIMSAMSEKEDKTLRNMVRFEPSCALPSTEVIKNP